MASLERTMNASIDRAGAAESGLALHVVITTADELLQAAAAAALGTGVLVFDDVDAALSIMEQHAEQLRTLLVDVGDIGTQWTGLRLLRHIREDVRLAHVGFWFLAARPDGGALDAWISSAAVTGIAKRSIPGLLGVLRDTGADGPEKGSIEAALARERLSTDALLRRLGMSPQAWRLADGALRLEPLLKALLATSGEQAGARDRQLNVSPEPDAEAARSRSQALR